MKIELHEITVRELAEGYKDDQENGVTGYGGKLDIRPKYQRELSIKSVSAMPLSTPLSAIFRSM